MAEVVARHWLAQRNAATRCAVDSCGTASFNVGKAPDPRALAALRKRGYDEKDLFNSNGRYSSVNWMSVTIQVVASFVGWGLVTNGFASWLSWQGYLLGPIGLGGKEGAWAYSNLGVAAALTIGFIGHWFLGRAAIKQQESA